MQVENPFRRLPQVQRVLELPEVEALCDSHGRAAVTEAVRGALESFRGEIGAGGLGEVPDLQVIVACAGDILALRQQRGLRRTINATGIVLHTNLGRAPLAAEAIAAVAEVAAGYCNLEFDLGSGARGSLR